jgi:hypothetical protein
MQLSAYIAMWNAEHPDLQIEQAMIVLFTDSKKTGLGEVFIFEMDQLKEAWHEYSQFLIQFLLMYVPELATPERLSLISSYEICKAY